MKNFGPLTHQISNIVNNTELLNEHHLTGLYYKFYEHQDGQNQYKKQWIHNQTILQVLEDLNKLLYICHKSVIILKGSHLLFDIYTDHGSRFLSDIDLLVSVEDLSAVEKILGKYGCEPIAVEKFNANNFKTEWCKKFGNIEINIEIHTRLFYHNKNENWNLVPTQFTNLKKLSNEDLFIHLCGHLAFQHSFIKLYWLYDIYYLYLGIKDSINWQNLKTSAIKKQLYRSVQMCLWILSQNFAITLVEPIENIFELEKNVFWKKILNSDFLMYPKKNQYRYFYIKHATKDQLRVALLYDLYWFYHYLTQKSWLTR